MNLNVLWGLIIYYALISIFFVAAVSSNIDVNGASGSNAFNTTTITGSEAQDLGTGTSFSAILRFIGFLFLGVGLPADTPSFIVVTFAIWQIGLNMFTIGFIYQALRGG